ncbi:MAG: hypothetical protein K2J68_05265 [Treponemataceae bacterium]|nr:hypothetical protein [Treponemataceae bacterium]MDE6719248.1 hypothetical protein [Treponemataceae bacterium]
MKIKTFVLLSAFFLSLCVLSCKSTEQAEETPSEKVVESNKVEKQSSEEDSEYRRSVGTEKNISLDTFNADKAAIVKKITELNAIMAKRDYNSWLKYIDPESQKYWSTPANLAKASEKLPKNVKGLKLRTLQDYFIYVFIPSRNGRTIDEIRYNSADSIRAVQVSKNEDGTNRIVVYYNFVRQDGDWKVYLPRL